MIKKKKKSRVDEGVGMLGSLATVFNKVIRVGLCERGHVSRLEGGKGVRLLKKEYKGQRCLACLSICKRPE